MRVPEPSDIVRKPSLLKDLRGDLRRLMLATVLTATYVAERRDVEAAYRLLKFMLEELAEPAIVLIAALPKDMSKKVLLKIAVDISKGRISVSEQFMRIWRLRVD